MSNTAPFDLRQDLFRSTFESALTFEDYLASGKVQHSDRWRNCLKAIELSQEQERVVVTFTRQMNVLVVSGLWCGDCARQGPMLHKLSMANNRISLRFIDNESNPQLRDELRIHGAARVPVVLTLSEDFFEVERFGDRTLSAYQRKAANELGAACDSGIGLPTPEELSKEVGEWLAIFERQQLMLRVSPLLRKRYSD